MTGVAITNWRIKVHANIDASPVIILIKVCVNIRSLTVIVK